MSYLKDLASIPDKVELVCRVATMLLQTHHNQLVATPSARPILTILRDILYARVKECKDTLGFNLAAMDHLKVCRTTIDIFMAIAIVSVKETEICQFHLVLQQLMSSKSDALFRDAKSKLQEFRLQHSKRLEARTETKEEKRRKKKQKSSGDMHARP
ncbi:hypothetical protein HHK36_032700 [Tetracentron sinense]|uniref:Small-subunit processome Utp12 domain-containing protein n=1 Tax=Tetracentron sinense TaxID=13715 RepID=A0A834Y9U5_TETSI|nr:hypothetical protein HHK36_032700 [Tetracentron sinense]